MKCVRGIKVEELSWHEFKRLFRKKYLSGRYYDGKAKEFYELKMGSMTDEEYMTKLMEFLRFMTYLKDEKTKFQRLISGLPLTFKDWIEYDEPRSLEEVIWKLKHVMSSRSVKFEPKCDWKGNEKAKGKWPQK